jgi:hypothetical protein
LPYYLEARTHGILWLYKGQRKATKLRGKDNRGDKRQKGERANTGEQKDKKKDPGKEDQRINKGKKRRGKH